MHRGPPARQGHTARAKRDARGFTARRHAVGTASVRRVLLRRWILAIAIVRRLPLRGAARIPGGWRPLLTDGHARKTVSAVRSSLAARRGRSAEAPAHTRASAPGAALGAARHSSPHHRRTHTAQRGRRRREKRRARARRIGTAARPASARPALRAGAPSRAERSRRRWTSPRCGSPALPCVPCPDLLDLLRVNQVT